MTRLKWFILWMSLGLGLSLCQGNVEAHDWHMWDVHQLTSVRMQYCKGYMLAETKEFGILLIEKVGDLNHNNLHITKVDEYECVYKTEEED